MLLCYINELIFPLKDIEGDRLSNRLTLPIRFGEEVSRVAFLLGLLGCSLAVPHVWQLCVALRLFFVAFGAYIGVRTYFERTVAQDKRNFKTYNVCAFFFLQFIALAYTRPLIRSGS